MADTTPVYGWPYQELTDPPDGAGLGEDLALAIETDLAATDAAVAALDTRLDTAEADIDAVEPKAAVLYDQRTTDASNITNTTLVSVLSVTLPKTGTYVFDALIPLTNPTAVGRPAFALGGTSTPTAWRWVAKTIHYNTATGTQSQTANGTTYPGSTSGQTLVNSDFTTTSGYSSTHIKGTVTVSAVGTLTFRFSEGAGSGAVSVKAAAMVTVQYIG